MTRPTPERLQEIRESLGGRIYLEGFEWELLAEIDALKEELEEWKWKYLSLG